MARIADIFASQRSRGRAGLIPFVTAGYPSMAATEAVLPALEEAIGPAVVEIGIPFSDPIADGPVIAASMHEALRAGVTPDAVFEAVAGLRGRTGHAIVAMVSMSIVWRTGPRRFIEEAAAAGFDGLIVPDLDAGPGPDRIDELAAGSGLAFPMLIAPNTPEERVESIARRCRGFVYVLARLGVSGARGRLPDLAPRVDLVRRHTELPVAVGFGITTPRQVAPATRAADAAIVGSALVRRMGRSRDSAAAAAEFAGRLARSLSRRPPARA